MILMVKVFPTREADDLTRVTMITRVDLGIVAAWYRDGHSGQWTGESWPDDPIWVAWPWS